jgi:hypothetical protein
MGGNGWRKGIENWSQEGRERRGTPEMKWESEVERVTKRKNLTPEDAVKKTNMAKSD